MATLRPAPFRQRQEGDVPVSPPGRDGENASANREPDYSRKRPLCPPDQTERLLQPDERLVETAPKRAPGEWVGQGQPDRRRDKSRPDMRRRLWDRRTMGDDGTGERQQRPDVGERSKVWKPNTRPLRQSYQRQVSRERPSPEKGTWRNHMSSSPRKPQNDASGLLWGDASRSQSTPFSSPKVTKRVSDASSLEGRSGFRRQGLTASNTARPAFQRRGSNLSNHSRSPSSSSRSDGWLRSPRDAWGIHDSHDKHSKNNFCREPKRQRTFGPRQVDKRWQSNGPDAQREVSSTRQAPTKSFAERFVPRADCSNQYYEKHVRKQPFGDDDETVNTASHHGKDTRQCDRNTHYEKHVGDNTPSDQATMNTGVKETAKREENAFYHGNDAKHDDGNSFGELQQTQPTSTVAERQKNAVLVNKLPACLDMKPNSLKDILKDTFTPDLTEASIATSLVASVSYSSCSQSAIVIESPHSLTHPEDEHIEAETKDTRNFDPKETFSELNESTASLNNCPSEFAAAPFALDLQKLFAEDEDFAAPTPAHWVRRSTRVLHSAQSVDVNVPMSVTVIKDTDDVTVKKEPPPVNVGRTLEKDHDTASPVPAHFVSRSVRQPSRSGLSDGKHRASTQRPLTSSTAESDSDDSSDSSGDETDEEELFRWAQMMLGVPSRPQMPADSANEPVDISEGEPKREEKSSRRPKLTLHLQMRPNSNRSKPSRQRKPVKGKAGQNKASKSEAQKNAEEAVAMEEAKRKKALAKPLTAADVRRILAEDGDPAAPATHWVRRSDRQPWRSALNHPSMQSLLGKLRDNDYDMTVLKMKKYLSDPDTPQMMIDAALDALEENTNCQALYIQNFNQGMRDEQVLHLLTILQMPSCNIWCLNIGETYNVKTGTWELFAKGLEKTKITHMYASEHTISTALKDKIRESIRKNRFKHDMHNSPDNLDVIVQCTHCWWNPINAKVLRPYLSKRGLDFILHDKEAQGLKGSMSTAPAGDAGKV